MTGADIGGGSVANDTPHSLARIPLRWMIRQCFLAKTGIQFEAEKLRDIGLAPETLYPRVIQRHHPDIQASTDGHQGGSESADMQEDSQHLANDASQQRSWLPVTALKMGRLWRESSGGSTLVEGRPTTSHSSSDVGSESDNAKSDNSRAGEEVTTEVNVDDEGTSNNGLDASGGKRTGAPARARPMSEFAAISEARAAELLAMEEEEERIDALCPIYDQLTRKKIWWLLELLPWSGRVQTDKGQWEKRWA